MLSINELNNETSQTLNFLSLERYHAKLNPKNRRDNVGWRRNGLPGLRNTCNDASCMLKIKIGIIDIEGFCLFISFALECSNIAWDSTYFVEG